jgi:hypothetical protein
MIQDEKNYQLVLAQTGYDAYGKFREWKTYDGKPMLQWDELPLEIKMAWIAAAVAIVESLD